MLLEHIYLTCFRNFTARDFSIHPKLTIIVGENARGKTNLLEAIFFSMNGIGFREQKEEELVYWEQEKSIVETTWKEEGLPILFQIALTKKGDRIEKAFYVNKTGKTHGQYLNFTTKAILFSPEHMDIVLGAPDKRREYLNRVLSLTDPVYKSKLRNYEHALRKRNKLLELHKNEQELRDQLPFWDNYLEEMASYITAKRAEYVAGINTNVSLEDRVLRMEYVKNEMTKERLAKAYDLEIRMRKTSIGPQKDDFQMYLVSDNEKNIHAYGSRSEQRLSVFWLKLYEIYLIEALFHKKPVLLLDDISSELDTHNKKLVLHLIEKYQTIITTTEVQLAELAEFEKTEIVFG
ncbi:DNA replication/repair protein RecF [Candidatus Roizmanbacteria bacterium]|nr:DNA replication/repair protein RecF [Candidatus Roizmanbacteria bacterium]